MKGRQPSLIAATAFVSLTGCVDEVTNGSSDSTGSRAETVSVDTFPSGCEKDPLRLLHFDQEGELVSEREVSTPIELDPNDVPTDGTIGLVAETGKTFEYEDDDARGGDDLTDTGDDVRRRDLVAPLPYRVYLMDAALMSELDSVDLPVFIDEACEGQEDVAFEWVEPELYRLMYAFNAGRLHGANDKGSRLTDSNASTLFWAEPEEDAPEQGSRYALLEDPVSLSENKPLVLDQTPRSIDVSTTEAVSSAAMRWHDTSASERHAYSLLGEQASLRDIEDSAHFEAVDTRGQSELIYESETPQASNWESIQVSEPVPQGSATLAIEPPSQAPAIDVTVDGNRVTIDLADDHELRNFVIRADYSGEHGVSTHHWIEEPEQEVVLPELPEDLAGDEDELELEGIELRFATHEPAINSLFDFIRGDEIYPRNTENPAGTEHRISGPMMPRSGVATPPGWREYVKAVDVSS